MKVKIAKHWKTLVTYHVGRNKPKRPLVKAKVTIIRFSSSEPDFDGLVSAGKHLLDGLKFAGIIYDDKMSIIGRPIYLWARCKPREGRVTIKVKELSHGENLHIDSADSD